MLRVFSEFYKYDDAGNRIKKVVMKYTGTAQDSTIEDSGDAPPNWNYELIQHYVRDVGGNEFVVCNDITVTFSNV